MNNSESLINSPHGNQVGRICFYVQVAPVRVTAQMVSELLPGKKPAQTAIKSLLDHIARPKIDLALMEDTARRLADIRATPEAQAALADFLSR